MSSSAKKKGFSPEKNAVYPLLFDFRLNNKYYIINIKIDEKGERIKAISNL